MKAFIWGAEFRVLSFPTQFFPVSCSRTTNNDQMKLVGARYKPSRMEKWLHIAADLWKSSTVCIGPTTYFYCWLGRLQLLSSM